MVDSKTMWPGWETMGLIGRGSFGSVYKIQRDVLGDVEEAALKVISIPQNDSDIEEMYSDGYDDESITSTFRAHLKSIVSEYSLMRKMNGSTNIVNCDDICYIQHENGLGWDIFIKMELLTPLTKAIETDIPERTVVKLAKDMCAALEMCAEYNIIHRDIKPQNIFVSKRGDYKLGDFGIAKTVEKTMGGTKIGTYKYMAPEVYNNQPYNATADIYSLGLVLYWMLNERRMPFMPLPPEKLSAGMEEQARNRRMSGEKIPEPKNGSKELKRIILKACAFDPKDRYQSAALMHKALDALISVSEPVVVKSENEKTDSIILDKPQPDPKPEPKPDPKPDPGPVKDPGEGKRKKKKWVIWLLLGLALLAGIGVAGYFVGTNYEVTRVAIEDEMLEEFVGEEFGAIGCYEHKFRINLDIPREISMEVGEEFNDRIVRVYAENSAVPVITRVREGKVTICADSEGTHMITLLVPPTNSMSWSEWSEELPDDLGLDTDAVEVARFYRTRQKEFKTSNKDKLDGWELYNAVENDKPYGKWSKWTEKELKEAKDLQVETKTQYRSRKKETTTSRESKLEGWTLDHKEAHYSYGNWSEWSTTPKTETNTLDVEISKVFTVTLKVYVDGAYSGTDTMTFTTKPGFGVGSVYDEGDVGGKHYKWVVSSIKETTKYRSRTRTLVSITYYYYRWTDWSKWGDESIKKSDTVKVQKRTVYRSRDIYGDKIYHFQRWLDWSEWSLIKPQDAENMEVESCWMYRVME